MADYKAFYEARDTVTEILRQELIGPVHTEEILKELPVQYYIMGKLYPQDENSDALDLARNPFLENETEAYDASISLSNQRNPSSIGVTCTIKKDVQSFAVSGKYAFYEPVEDQKEADSTVSTEGDESQEKSKVAWKRKEYRFSRTLECVDEHVVIEKLERNMQIQVYTHTVLPDGARILTVVLVNLNKADGTLETASRECAFQTELCISGVDDTEIFSDTEKKSHISTDPELLEMELLYSDIKCYGQGHGCSVTWDLDHQSPHWVKSSFFPSYNLKQMMPAQFPELRIMQMKYLAETDSMEIVCQLDEFAGQYRDWIESLKSKVFILPASLQEVARENIQKCEAAYIRLKNAVKMLGDDKIAMRAFKLANEAMYMQRCQTLKKAKRDIKEENITWYPFQLAFILHELPSFIDPKGDDRKKVDLLWFPTGGGKTEAYLGITAFTIFLRRLRNVADDGVTVIMRYTLRLLTLQQFERASMLICACEIIRQKYNLGSSEISIGLWVGGKLTPNALSEARTAINKLQAGAVSAGESNPCQIKVCPWCGSTLTPHDYSVSIGDRRMKISCSNLDCDFHKNKNGLPVHIVDEAIYEYLPTFIVATVDKFAQIPLSDKPAALFGISSHKKPPELIIQDELHLISGPLGTMTGIYEAAISTLCEHKNVPVKVIASTATIRNAGNQIKALYCRDYTQFPPQGITARDSFFAIESSEEERPVRQYFGIMGIGITATTTLIRVNAALIFATRYLSKLGYADRVIDNFWTITGYFNSLRELGGASTQIMDDVQSRYRYLVKTKFAHIAADLDLEEKADNLVELTSRMNNSDITRVIQVDLKRDYHADSHDDVLDFVLASNMISVGVDVGRLGVMVVEGQPKTNSEYIQATSRVGRDNPGLVLTLYNPSRSRDRSHYEQFLRYHMALYRYVEATSLTPFADRARDRGLHALYVSLCRYMVPGMIENNKAGKYDPSNPVVRQIKDIIINYVEKIDPDELEAVIRELDDIESIWEHRATGSLVYRTFQKNEKALLKKDTDADRFRTMNSMRNVDASPGVYLLGR